MESQPCFQHELKSLILAADGHFSSLSPGNDQMWALNLDGGDTHPFHLHTTYNLRAKSMRVVPNITIGNHRLVSTNYFTGRPTISHYTPASARVRCQLIESIDVIFDLLLPDTDVLVGCIEIHNNDDQLINLTAAVSAILVPMGEGIPTRAEKSGLHRFIAGHTEKLWPVLFMSGGPAAHTSPYPALSRGLEILPYQSMMLSWALVTKESCEASLETARHVIARDWHGTMRKHLLTHSINTIEIHTGDSDWDAVFALAQSTAMTHLVACCPEDSEPYFVRNRLPNQSTLNEKNNHCEDDLTILEATHLSQVVLPAHVEKVVVVVKRFLKRISQQGRIPSRLNLPASNKPENECPMLANLCVELYEINSDKAFLKEVYPGLCQFLFGWLNKRTFQEKDYFPAWESAQQLQLDMGLFTFDIWEPTGCGLDIRTVESPALAAMLYREVTALGKIAGLLADESGLAQFESMERQLQKKIDGFWQDDLGRYAYLDQVSHLSQPRELVWAGTAGEYFKGEKNFLQPRRLQIHLFSVDELSRGCTVSIKGQTTDGEPISETFSHGKVRWVMGRAHLTTHNLFGVLHSVMLSGLQPGDTCLLETANLYQGDITCLLPVWSGGGQKEHNQVILKKHLNRQHSIMQFGIPDTWQEIGQLPEGLQPHVNLLWNTLIIQGMVREGFVTQAMHMFTGLMSAIVNGLANYEGFYPCYQCDNGRPVGQPNGIGCLAPVRLFLEIAGIRLFRPDRIALWGVNPFPWPIEVHWQGLSIRRKKAHTEVMFPDGTTYVTDSKKPIQLMTGKEAKSHV